MCMCCTSSPPVNTCMGVMSHLSAELFFPSQYSVKNVASNQNSVHTLMVITRKKNHMCVNGSLVPHKHTMIPFRVHCKWTSWLTDTFFHNGSPFYVCVVQILECVFANCEIKKSGIIWNESGADAVAPQRGAENRPVIYPSNGPSCCPSVLHELRQKAVVVVFTVSVRGGFLPWNAYPVLLHSDACLLQ